ncbi:unnamed protein product [Polarella glacialis]|uniref:Uncharacterized protein n=1 Tax=Polarella glacialis TaxID=89957 RepID=A0A813IPX2_POLGL|nr:unnamed protein product [Polarella glacialis]
MQPGHRRPTPPWRKLRLVPQLANTASSQEPQEQAADAKMVEPERKTPIKPSGTPSRQGSRPGSRPASKAQKLDSSTASVPVAQEEVGKVGAQVAERLYSKPSALTPTQAKPKSRATAPSQQTSRPTTPRTESASSRPEGALPKEVTATGALEKEALAPEPSAANASMAQVPAFPEAEELTTTEATPNRILLPGELASTAHKDDEEAAPKDDEEAEFEEEKDDEYDDDDGFEEDNEYDNDDGFEEEADDDDNNNHTNNHNNNNDDGFEEDADESISPTSAHSTWKVAEATAGSEEVSDGGSVAQLETTPVASAPLSPSVAPSRGGSADRDEYEDFEEDSSDGKGRGGGGGALEEEEPSSPLLGDFSEGPESPTTTADFGDVIAPGRPESPTTTTPTTPTAAPTTIPPTTTPAPTATTATTPPTTPTPTTTTTPLPPTAPTAAATAAEPGRRSPGQEPEKEDFFEVDELSEESLGEQPEQQRQYSFAQHGDEEQVVEQVEEHNEEKMDGVVLFNLRREAMSAGNVEQ